MGPARKQALVIRGGTIVDESGSRSGDVLVEDGVVRAVGAPDVPSGAMEIDASGCYVSPGLVDLHTHLRQPGREEAETVQSGARAAALGGYTAVLAMPNTEPPVDDVSVVREIRLLARDSCCDVHVAGAITVGRAGERLAPIAELADAGVRVFTDDGSGVQDAGLMRRAFQYTRALQVTLAQHCEDASMAAGGQMNEGRWSSLLGMAGQPSEAEELMVMRDLALCRLTGGRLHLLHLSTAGSVGLVRSAKAAGTRVTAEATPHHFTLTDECARGYDPVFKVSPPLRTSGDVEELRRGLGDGTVDAIATDHAPHPQEAKELPFEQAPPGMTGLETALGLAITELELSIESIVSLMSWRPARIAGLERHGGPIMEGRPANLCVIDPEERWTVEGSRMASLSQNNPFIGRELKGRARHTILEGELTVHDGEPQR